MRPLRDRRSLLFVFAPLLLLMGVGFTFRTSIGAAVLNQSVPPAPDVAEEVPNSLKTVKPPVPSGLDAVVRDRQALLVMGKALYWDMSVGSDGVQACASCHFHAGADVRTRNQVNPGNDELFQVPGPNGVLTAANFPFHKLTDPDDKSSTVLFDTDDRVSSQGVSLSAFLGVNTSGVDMGEERADGLFHSNGLNVRRVEPRNAPTTINAAFNFRNFWDGRASATFNGVDPFGEQSDARILVKRPSGVVFERLSVRNASLASQAVGPVLSSIEASFASRQFPFVGRKLIGRRPLAHQEVSATDSVLGSKRHPSGRGLDTTYEALIKQAFSPELWDSRDVISCMPDCGAQPSCHQGCGTDCTPVGSAVLGQPNCKEGYVTVQPPLRDGGVMLKEQFLLMEANFSVFFGLAVMAYEMTLISDDAPFDQYRDGDANALSAAAKRGLEVFMDDGQCISCHRGPEFTSAASDAFAALADDGMIERMKMGDGGVAIYDHAFYNIGVRPAAEDVGIGGTAPNGEPLSLAARFAMGTYGQFNNCKVEVPFSNVGCGPPPLAIRAQEKLAVMGAFKVPTLRNVELTGPYFHNGGNASLEQVVEFYNRGGDFHGESPNIEQLGLTAQQASDLVEFIKALTDDRVRYEKAPFDHPELCVPDGHVSGQYPVDGGVLSASSVLMRLPPVGAQGGAKLHTFAEILNGSAPSHFDGACPSAVVAP